MSREPDARRWAWAVAAIGCVMLLVWWLMVREVLRRATLASTPAVTRAAPPLEALIEPATGTARALAPLPQPAPAVPAMPEPIVADTRPSRAAQADLGVFQREVEVCGLGVMPMVENSQSGVGPVVDRIAAESRARAQAALLASAVERERAAGLVLGGDTDQLIRMAVTTRDAAVYSMAVERCRPLQGEAAAAAACSLLSPQRWTQLDPDNLVPWLHVAEVARARGDAGAVAEAIYRASLARVSDPHWNLLSSLILRALPPNEPPLGRLGLMIEAIGIDTARATPGYSVLSEYCKANALSDANRRQVCAAAAEVLVHRGKTYLDVNIGLAIGKRAGWRDDVVQALRDTQDALMQAPEAQPPHADLWSCNGIQRFEDWITQVSNHGEPEAALRLAAKAGVTLEQLRARLPAIRAERAAHAASAASEAASAHAGAASASR